MPHKPTHDESKELLNFMSGHPGSEADRKKALNAIRWAFEVNDAEMARRLLEWVREGAPPPPGGGAPPQYRIALLRLLRRAFADPRIGVAAGQRPLVEPALARQDTESLRSHIGPALRLVIGQPRDEDIPGLQAWLTQLLKETSMAFNIDTSSIPTLQNPATDASGKTILDRFYEEVRKQLVARFGMPAANADVKAQPQPAAILGMVVLDGENDPASSGLQDALRRAWLESIGEIPNKDGGKTPLPTVYDAVAGEIRTINHDENVSVQELAFVAREVIAGAPSIPFGHPNFGQAIRIALDKYVETRTTGDSLALPAGSLPGGTQNAGGDADLVSENIRVVGLAYSLALLEKTLLLPVTDRMSTMFMNGQTPFGHDAAGKALDDYYWDTEDRLTESQRRSHYSRMVGMPGGEVSKEIAPNKDFEQIFLRFISSVSEFTRQREVDRMFTNRNSNMSITGEQVRKCAFEVTKNASLYGYGAGFYITTRINKQLQRSIEILNQPQVLKTYAASNHWQVVERVAQQDFGGTPNWSKYSTMAQAASNIFNVLAKYTAAVSTTNSGRPFLFDETQPNLPSDVGRDDTNLILSSVQAWLAVNGVRDEQVKQYSQPVELTSAPSLPGVPAPSGAGSATDVINKLKQLTASGTPNPDQLQQLLATLH